MPSKYVKPQSNPNQRFTYPLTDSLNRSPTARVPSIEDRDGSPKTPVSSPEINYGGKERRSDVEKRASRKKYWSKIVDMVCDGMLLASGGGAVTGRNENESAGVVRIQPKKQ
ncbi:hypothetical protein LTR56_016380 [Elasticomyces elasticus]|nr:hypothetical protein LTR56_016380 [Elasticomyces elasticus]KAK3636257.1 hypothetical protein LTR22_018777 [Elasticomyces elasticus]KAK4912075.1 hypothetical protein LTR49_019451 [Elasticomyces elasticus]KAK5751764.1 hypothetical protein LTS12_018178 [Elasticomyces elasticus]